MRNYSGFSSCIIPEPALLSMSEAGQQLFTWQSVCKGQQAESNSVQVRRNAVEQRDSESYFGEMPSDGVQKRQQTTQRRFDRHSHDTNRQEREATAVDKSRGEKMDTVCAMGLGENLRPVAGLPDRASQRRQNTERYNLKLLPRHAVSTHQHP